jgi:type I restriction enzyme S subunit
MRNCDDPAFPDNWAAVTLEQLLDDIEAGKSFECLTRPATVGEWGIIKVSAMTWGAFDERENKAVPVDRQVDHRYEIRPGDLLLSRANTTALVGATVLVSQCRPRLLLSDKSMRLRVKRGIDNRWLRLALSSPSAREQMSAVATGTSDSMRNISQEKVRALRLGLPPLPEQRRIVAEIEKQFSRLDAGVAALKRVQANLKQYRAAVLQAACEGRLVPTEAELARAEGREYESADELLERVLAERRSQWEESQLAKIQTQGKANKGDEWRGRYQEPCAPDAEAGALLPKGWVWTTLDAICPVFVDCAHRTPTHAPDGYPALRPRDVVQGILRLDTAAKVPAPEYELQTRRRVPQSGDIVYSRELSYGWGAVVPESVEICLGQGMVLFRPASGVLASYLLYVLNGPLGRRQADDAATGSAHPHINVGEIRSYRVPLPPHAEQQRIVEEIQRCLSITDGILLSLAKNLHRAERLRQAILKQAFEGKLVAQDPSDEPASVLLERIRAERAAAAGNGSGRVSGRKRKERVPRP